jgi:hypothetical protein
MWFGLIAALLIGDPAAAPPAPPHEEGITYHSKKNLAALQSCLTDKLADIGEVVAVTSDEGTTTLVLRSIPEGPMTIDLEPPSVTVTSKPTPHTRHLIKACL